jgi:16S rRNA (cytidine1402-2'-O)-methyltransferase
LATVTSVTHAVTFFESPHRIRQTLLELATICGNRPIVVGRELTKLHETCYRGTAQTVATEVEARGELTIMLGPAVQTQTQQSAGPTDEGLAEELGHMTDNKGGRRAALKTLAARHGLSLREVYAAVERGKKR